MKKEKYFSKAEIKKLWLQFIFLATALSAFILYGFHAIHKQEQMFKERGVVTTATILSSGGKYAEFQYEVNGIVYTKTERKPYIYEFKIGGKYKLIYDPLDPEICDLCMDDNNQYFPMEDIPEQKTK